MKFLILLFVLAINVDVHAELNLFNSLQQFQDIIQNFLNQFTAVPYKLCNYSEDAYKKCVHTVDVAKNNSIKLPLECVKSTSRVGCLMAMRSRQADMVVLTGHWYQKARNLDFEPTIYARNSDDSLYIAVAPKDIKLTAVYDTPIIADLMNHRAFHAAVFFNLQRGHDICLFWHNARDADYIKMVDSALYTPNDDEILLCPGRTFAFANDYKNCNFEAGLQRAVFMRKSLPNSVIVDIKERVFDALLQNFGQNSDVFNFFKTFQGKNNTILKDNTIGFDLQPTYRNGVTEKLFTELHCEAGPTYHSPSQLE